jgi:aquaporin Z
MENKKTEKYTWQIFLSECIGTALLLLVALSIVIFMFGTGSPMPEILPGMGIRRLITGFLFGSTGALISMSRIGKVSGAHLNPVVTFVFLLMRRIDLPMAGRYVSGQLTGAVAGCLPLLAWGSIGRSVEFGATMPGEGYTMQLVLLGEILTTFTMLCLLAIFLASQKLRPYTPALFPVLYSLMVYAEGAISGTSTNPARSLGPSVVSGYWAGWWIYWIGPFTGAILAGFAVRFLVKHITVAKLYHFNSQKIRLFGRNDPPKSALKDNAVPDARD